MSWLYHRPVEGTLGFIEAKFSLRPEIAEANTKAFKAGWNYGETSEDFAVSYEVAPAKLAPGTYRQISGNSALTYGLIAASKLSGLPLFLGAYPITPASDVLEQLANLKDFGVRTFQAEDEIAASGAALGAAFGGSLGVTTSAGPGIVLKSETVGLAVTLELPLVIVDVQRAGPSTGMPTKPEQADLLMVLFGRNSESPVPVVAASTPAGCFDAAIEAADRDQVQDAGVPALGRVPGERVRALAHSGRRVASRTSRPSSQRSRTTPRASSRTGATPRRSRVPGPSRDTRPRAPHRRAREAGRDRQRLLRPGEPRPDGAAARGKDRGIASDIPSSRSTTPAGPTRSSSVGAPRTAPSAAARRVRASGRKVAIAHLHHLNPFPRNTGEVVRGYERCSFPRSTSASCGCCCGPSSSLTRWATTRCADACSGPRSSRTRSRRWWTHERQ